MRMRCYAIPLLLTAALGLTACSGAGRPALNRCEPGNCPPATDQGFLRFTFGLYPGWAPYGAWGLPVNLYLWRGALDTLRFMPLDSVDPMDGMIITDWYTPPNAPGERVKAQAFILGPALSPDNLRISVYRQVLRNGRWVDAAASPRMAAELENEALGRARQLWAMGGG